MALKTTVKISSVNNLSDARYCAGMGVDLMGFQLSSGTPEYINYQNFVELTGWVSGVQFVGEFIHSTAEEINTINEQFELDYVQIADVNLIDTLNLSDAKLILKYNMDELADAAAVAAEMAHYAPQVAYFLFESDLGIVYKAHVESAVLKLAEDYPILFGFNLTEEKALMLAENDIVKGIALKGGEEIRPGYKDFDEMADILEALEVED